MGLLDGFFEFTKRFAKNSRSPLRRCFDGVQHRNLGGKHATRQTLRSISDSRVEPLGKYLISPLVLRLTFLSSSFSPLSLSLSLSLSFVSELRHRFVFDRSLLPVLLLGLETLGTEAKENRRKKKKKCKLEASPS